MRFVFRPRSWVRRLGNCVMKQHQLRAQAGAAPANFITAYIRESIEKDRELRKCGLAPLSLSGPRSKHAFSDSFSPCAHRYGHSLVPHNVWTNLSVRVARALNVSRVFLQTSSARALERYTREAGQAGAYEERTHDCGLLLKACHAFCAAQASP